MSKSEEYKLCFNKKRHLGSVLYEIQSLVENNPYSNLWFIAMLDLVEINNMITEISNIQNNLPYDPAFIYTDGTESIEIEFNYPNVIIDDYLKIHIDDMKAILEEWKEFRRQ